MDLDRYRQRLDMPLWFVVIAAMVLFLAFTVQQSLSYLVTSPERSSGTYRVLVHETEAQTPPTEWPTLWIDLLIVDGHRMQLDTVNRSTDWATIAKRGSWAPIDLVYQDGPASEFVSFTGASFLMTARARAWSGTIEVERENQVTQVVKVQVPSGQLRNIVLEGPPAPVSTAVLMGAVLIFGLAAGGIAPWKSDARAGTWLLFFLVAFNFLSWMTQPVSVTNDSRAYLQVWHDNTLNGYPGYFPPGYPAFLGLIEVFSGENFGRWVTFVQHTLAILAAYWIYLLASRIVPRNLAMVSGILAGTLSPMMEMSQSVMSESTTTFAMVGAFYFGLRAAETGKLRFAVPAGALAGWAGLLRGVPIVALLSAIGLLVFFSSAKRKWGLTSVTFGVAVGVVLFPLAWFAYKTGNPALTTATGTHLYTRVVFEQKLLDESGPATQVLLKLLDGEDPRPLDWPQVIDRLAKNIPDRSERNDLLLRVSREAMLKNPLAYLSYTPGLAWRLFIGDLGTDADLAANTITLDPAFESPPPLELTATGIQWRYQLEWLHRLLWPVLCWAAVLGTILGLLQPQRGLVLALACVPFCYLLACASVTWFYTRYRIPTIPFVVILSILPFRVLLSDWSATFTHRRLRLAKTFPANILQVSWIAIRKTQLAVRTFCCDLRRVEYLRDLLRELVVRDIKLRYNRSILGIAWSLLVPLAELGILYFVFGTVLPLHVPHFVSYLFSGLLPWAWFSSSLLAATVATRQHKDLLQQVGFPAGILPVITITSQLIHFLLALPILFAFLWVDGRPLTFAIAALPVVMALQFAFTLGLTYFLAPLEALFHDTHHVLSLALPLLFYVSPVFYEVSAIPPQFSLVYNLNPLVHLLVAYRSVLIDGRFPPAGPLLIVGAISAILLVTGYRFYMHLHYRMLQEC